MRSLAPISALAADDRDRLLAGIAEVLAGEPDPIALRCTTEVSLWRALTGVSVGSDDGPTHHVDGRPSLLPCRSSFGGSTTQNGVVGSLPGS